MRTLGESHWGQYRDSQPAYLGRRAGSQVHEGVVHTERSLGRPHPTAGQVHRANSYNTRNRALEPLDGDPLAFDLLIEQGRDRARHPPKREVAVFPNPADHVARLVQGTDHQPLAGGAGSELEQGVPGAVASAPSYKSQNTINSSLLVPGYCGEPG
jgi:hypothetical protein